MAKMSMIYDALLDLHVEMILGEALAQYKRKKWYEAIDEALKNRDKELFMKLTNEWKEPLS